MSVNAASPDLRKVIADVLYQISANHLPTACERFGLAPGTIQEAWASKRKYVLARLYPLPRDRVLQIARDVLGEFPDHDLEEAIAETEEHEQRTISELTRRNIGRALNRTDLSGHIRLTQFLRELWPIDRMASPDDPFNTLAEDITRYAELNSDWTNYELLEALGAYTCSRWRFSKFLEAVVHPRTRSETEQRDIVNRLNPMLRRDGFALVPAGQISGYPVFSVQRAEGTAARPADAVISLVLAAFDEASVHSAWRKALDRRVTDPEGAITAARTLLETVCKHIIEDAGGTYGEGDDLPKLYHTAAEHLNLAPSQHTETVFKTILGNCQSVVNSLGSLRNKLSDAHGKGRKPARPLPRHAELVVNLAGTMATFLVSTWRARQEN